MRPREKQYTESIKNSSSQRRAYPKFQGLTKERERATQANLWNKRNKEKTIQHTREQTYEMQKGKV